MGGGPAQYEPAIKPAALYGPCEYRTSPEDAHGRDLLSELRIWPGGWCVIEDDHDCSILTEEPVLERRAAFVLSRGEC